MQKKLFVSLQWNDYVSSRKLRKIFIKPRVRKKALRPKHAIPIAFEVCILCMQTLGTNVLMKDFRRKKRKGGKLDYEWKGPYEITDCLGKGLNML